MLNPVLSFMDNSKGEICAVFTWRGEGGAWESFYISDLPSIPAWRDAVNMLEKSRTINELD